MLVYSAWFAFAQNKRRVRARMLVVVVMDVIDSRKNLSNMQSIQVKISVIETLNLKVDRDLHKHLSSTNLVQTLGASLV